MEQIMLPMFLDHLRIYVLWRCECAYKLRCVTAPSIVDEMKVTLQSDS